MRNTYLRLKERKISVTRLMSTTTFAGARPDQTTTGPIGIQLCSVIVHSVTHISRVFGVYKQIIKTEIINRQP